MMRRVASPAIDLIDFDVDMEGFRGNGFDGDMIRGHPSACLFVARSPLPHCNTAPSLSHPSNVILIIVSIP